MALDVGAVLAWCPGWQREKLGRPIERIVT
jgi:hypothetical protein